MAAEIAKWVGLVLGALLLQTTLVSSIEIFGVRPDLTTLILFFIAIRYGVFTGIWVGFFLGLAQDIYAASPLLGQAAMAKTIVGALFGFFNDRTMRTDVLVKGGIILSGFLVHDAIYHAAQLSRLARPLSSIPLTLLARTLPSALYSLMVAGGVYAYVTMIRPNMRR